MTDAATQIYDTLTQTSQQEAYDFMLFLKQRQAAKEGAEYDELAQQERLAALNEFAGSGAALWNGVDALEYQRELRQERIG